MKLPDFSQDVGLNDLKNQMGIPTNVYGDFILAIDPTRISLDEREKLNSGEGIDVDLKDLSILPDGTLAYKDGRILLYIRDVRFGFRREDPRYHLANCATLQTMRIHGRLKRYVISAEITGTFVVNREGQSERRRLPVCRYCLDLLKLSGYKSTLPPSQRSRIVEQFTPSMFFEYFPKSLHPDLPPGYSDTDPLNEYPLNMKQIADSYKEKTSWKCSKCSSDLSSFRKYLHVHHRDGDRRNNRGDNLEVLCIRCHGDEPFHALLRNHKDYKEYLRLRR